MLRVVQAKAQLVLILSVRPKVSLLYALVVGEQCFKIS